MDNETSAPNGSSAPGSTAAHGSANTMAIPFAGRRAGDILNDIRALSETERAKGGYFERLFCALAPFIPELEIQKILPYSEWQAARSLSAADYGIDLVARLNGGQEVAIQCKCYDEKYRVGKADLEKFIAGSQPHTFPLRWFVATTDYSEHAAHIIRDHNIRVIDFREYLTVDIPDSRERPEPRRPWPLQQEAIDAVVQGLSAHNRGKLIMACGTGKTFTALRIAEKLLPGAPNILFLAPSIALVAQSRREWLRHTRRPLACTVICSDSTAGQHGRSGSEDIGIQELSCAVTTDPQEIARELRTPLPEHGARVVFCTYQSLQKLCDAQREYALPPFDLALIDEAHRTTGIIAEDRRGMFQLIHDEEKINITKRLYMTATPRIYDIGKKKDPEIEIVDMNSVENYGPEFYRLTFKRAVEADMLCDYRVIALGIREGSMGSRLVDALLNLNDEGKSGKAADEQAILALGAIALAVNGYTRGKNSPGVLKRTIAYASNIRRSQWLKRALHDKELREWVGRAEGDDRELNVKAKHLDGSSSALQRNDALRWLNDDATEEEPHLISNARLFTEGVDVRSLNAIAFLDPRQSKVDTIQAVGRVMRRAEEKALGYIIVPVILPDDMDIIDVLTEDHSRFKSLGAVLRALQSHDERLETQLNERLTFDTINDDPTARDTMPPEDYQAELDLLDENAKQAIFAHIARNAGIAHRGKILADAITQAIERASRIFQQEGVSKTISETIGTPSDNELESCKTAALLIANACIMHRRLEETGNLSGLEPISAPNLHAKPSEKLIEAWHIILQRDYAPIFLDAVALVTELSRRHHIERALTILIQCAIDNAASMNDLGFDHAGPLYHKVLGKAQSDGAFYTKNLSAYLLAGLAFDEQFIDWKNARQVADLRVIDPACGTGTLLMAALNIIKKRAAEAQGLNETELSELHRSLVEKSIYGLDINKYSIQLAACNLTIGAPDTDYKKINLHTLPHGPLPGTSGDTVRDVRHGSLEKLHADDDEFTLFESAPLYGANVEREEQKLRIPSAFSAAIYNPPFTNTNKQSTHYGGGTLTAMRERLQYINKRLAENSPEIAEAIVSGSIRPYFTPLVKNMLPADRGRIAQVVPATACTAINGQAERVYCARHYHIEMIITSHDPKVFSFSENTAIHECLILGRRRAGNSKPTRFIQLTKYPADMEAADRLLHAIERGNAHGLYNETLWPAERMAEGDWTPVQWYHPNLAYTAHDIPLLAPPKLIALADIASIKDIPRTFRGNFIYTIGESHPGKANAFCTINEHIMNTMESDPETEALPRAKKTQRAHALWQQASPLFITARFSTNTSRLMSLHSPRPALGSAWYPIILTPPQRGNTRYEQALAAFLNSSFGIIQMLNRRTKKLSYPAFALEPLATLMLPHPDHADLKPLHSAFNELKREPLQRLEYCATDPARRALDHAAAASLGIDPAMTDQWRDWLSREPIIMNRAGSAESAE